MTQCCLVLLTDMATQLFFDSRISLDTDCSSHAALQIIILKEMRCKALFARRLEECNQTHPILLLLEEFCTVNECKAEWQSNSITVWQCRPGFIACSLLCEHIHS